MKDVGTVLPARLQLNTTDEFEEIIMGGQPYWYYTKYQTDIDTTLQTLRQQEFAAGRYNPVLPFIDFPITADSPAPGTPTLTSSVTDNL